MNLEEKRDLFKKDLYGLLGILNNNLIGIKIDKDFICKAKDMIENYKLNRSTTLLANLIIEPELRFDSGNAELIIKFADSSKHLIMQHFETNGIYWLELEDNGAILEDPIFDLSMLIDNDPLEQLANQIDSIIRPTEPMIIDEISNWNTNVFEINNCQPNEAWTRAYPVGTNNPPEMLD